MIINKLYFITLASALLLGCSSLKTRIPLAEVQTPAPTTKDTLRWEILKNTPSLEHVLTTDASARPPTLRPVDEKHVDLIQPFNTSLNYSFFDNIETGVTAGEYSGVQAKWIIMNRPVTNSNDSHLLSLYGSILNSNHSNSGNQNGEFGSGGYPWSARSDANSRNLGISYGYKNEQGLFYLGLAYNHFDVKTKIDHSTSDDGGSLAANYESISSGYSKSIGVGFEIGQETLLGGTALLNEISWGDIKKTDAHFQLTVSKKYPDFFYKEKPAYDLEPKDIWQGRDFGALGLSYIVGFGTGQAMQGTWADKGLYFAAIDGASLGVALSSGLRGGGVSSSAGAAIGVYIVSRIWQIVDVIIDASSHTSAVAKK